MRPLLRVAAASLAALFGATGVLAQEAVDDLAAGNDAVLPEPGVDWSVALRGSYVSNSVTGGAPGLSLAPEVSLALPGARSLVDLSAGGEIAIDGAGQARLADVHAGAESTYQLDRDSELEGAIDASLAQASPDDDGLPANTLIAPLEFETNAHAGATRRLGNFLIKGSFDGTRVLLGETTLDDLSTVDNASSSYWQGGATLRLGYEVTPLVVGFLEGGARLKAYDAPDPGLLAYLDARTYELRAGLAYAQGSVLSAEASIGRAWLDYVDPALTDAPGWTYNASLTLSPDETLNLDGALETAIGPSVSVAGDTDVAHTLMASLRYGANPWLTLRSTGEVDMTTTVGTGDVAWGYSLGAGFDYQGSRHVVWTADYAFSRDYAPPAPVSDTHTITVGVRVQR